ncbi:MAG: LysR family transcriptional regulator [Proteobacteria bacterium]|nr:LysR family transcriptional regulator [Burkholderiales bacterium]
MDLRQLRYFEVLATQRHYGRASTILHVAQPALSRQIRLLEGELGVRLFERHARGATPTDEALFLLERASFLLRYAAQMKQDMMLRQRDPRGTVAIGLSPGLAQQLAVPLTRAVQHLFPEVRLRIVEGFAPSLHSMLMKGGVDLAVLNGPVQRSNLSTMPLLTEEICLIGRPQDKPLRARKIKLARLAGLPLVITGLAKSGVRLELEAAAARAGVVLNQVVEVETVEVAKRLVLDGVEFTVHFAAAIKNDIDAGALRAVPIEGLKLRRVLARASDRPPSKATEAVMATLRGVVEESVQSGTWQNATLDR